MHVQSSNLLVNVVTAAIPLILVSVDTTFQTPSAMGNSMRTELNGSTSTVVNSKMGKDAIVLFINCGLKRAACC